MILRRGNLAPRADGRHAGQVDSADDGAVTTRRWRVRAAALISGAVVVLVFPQPSLWWAAWFVLVPWLILVRRAPTAREAAVRSWWAAFGFLLATHYWLAASLTVFLPLAAGCLALLWVPWGVLAWWTLAGRLSLRRLGRALVLLPAGWVLIETVRSWSALGGPWCLLGASQWRTPALLAPAALGGVWLVSFLVVAANVALVGVVEDAPLRTRAVALGSAAAIVASGPLWFAVQGPPTAGPELRVAVVQAGVVHGPSRRLADQIAATRRLPAGRYDLVIWGESSVGFDLFSRPDLQRSLAAQSARIGADLLVNVDAQAPGGSIRKTAVLVGPSGILGSYQKMRLVPFGEYIPLRSTLGWVASFTKAAGVNRVRGHSETVMHSETALHGETVLRRGDLAFVTLICFESAFPDMARTAQRLGARLLVYQSATTTFQGTWAPDQHASLAALRAVETGRPAIHATLAGTSAAFDAQGHRLLWHPAERGTASVELELATRTTFYDRFGDWVPAGSLVVLVLAAAVRSLRTTRAGR